MRCVIDTVVRRGPPARRFQQCDRYRSQDREADFAPWSVPQVCFLIGLEKQHRPERMILYVRPGVWAGRAAQRVGRSDRDV